MTHPLSATHRPINIMIIGDDSPERALVRGEATVKALLQSILAEFTREKELDENRAYSLFLGDKPLDPEATIAELDLKEVDILTLSYETISSVVTETGYAAPGSDATPLVLEEPKTGHKFTINRFPALIGRKDSRSREDVAVDLSQFEDLGERSVSRRHALLVESEGKIYIESRNPTNLARVGSRKIDVGRHVQLRHHDVIHLGKVQLIVHLHP